MAEKRKPDGQALHNWCMLWDMADHQAKLMLCDEYGVTYDTAKHWRSDSGIERKTIMEDPGREDGALNVPINVSTSDGVQVMAVINDTHHPFHDPVTIKIVENLLYDIKPNIIVYNGDMNDFYQISNFSKEPSRLNDLQADINMTNTMFARHSDMFPKAVKFFVEGTHEDRLRNFLWSKASALASLDALSIDKLFHLEDFNMAHIGYEQGILFNGVFLVLHGDIISKHSSYTAKMMFDKHGGCGIHGHSHRGGKYYKTDRFGIYGWWENYCLCSLNPDWIKNPNWQQGFSLVYFTPERFWVCPIPIINHKLMYQGKIYG